MEHKRYRQSLVDTELVENKQSRAFVDTCRLCGAKEEWRFNGLTEKHFKEKHPVVYEMYAND